MTISTTQDSVVIGGNGSTTSFSFPFVGVATSDISVVYTDASGNQTTLSPSQYTVTLNPLASGQIWQVGGTVTYPLSGSPIAVGTTLTISRTLPLTQTASISNQGDFYPQVVEQALDTLCMQVQQVSAEVALAVRAPASDGSLNVLPAAAKRANQALLFDANGQPIVGSAGGSGTPISAVMQPVVQAVTLADARTAMGVLSNMQVALATDSIATLRSYTSAAEPSVYAVVSGYYAQGDGGGGLYWYDSTDSTSADNGGTIIVDASGRRWKIANFAGVVSALLFGAKADYQEVASTGVTIASGSANLAVTGAAFTTSDVGKLISVPGAGASGAVLETTIFSVTDATHAVLSANASTSLSAATKTISYGTDNAAAIQAAITLGESNGAAVYIPRGLCKIGSPLTISGCLRMFGDGYGGDAGGIYAGSTAPVLQGTVLLPISTVNGLSIATNDAVALRDFQISYTGAPVAGGGVKGIAGTSAGSGANTYSVIRDVCITGADIGVDLLDWYDFDVDHIVVLNSLTTSMHLKVTTYVNYSDSTIANCSFLSGTVTNHLWVESSGGLRIINNKFNYGNGSAGQAIFINPYNYQVGGVSTAFEIEPLLIANNSIEGQIQGLVLKRQTGSLGQVSALSVTGNEFFVASSSIVFSADGANKWVSGFSVTGNTAICNVNSSEIFALDGCQNGIVAANSLNGSSSVTGATAVVVGSHTANVLQSGNPISSNISLPAVVTPSVPASGTPITNTNPYPVLVNIYGGTGTLVAINGNTIFSQGATYIFVNEVLNPGDTISITYTSTPPWVWRALNP